MEQYTNEIIEAIENNDLEFLRAVINERNVDLRIKDDDNDTLIMHAFSYASLDVCYFLLEKGADFRIVNNIGESVLHSAVYSNDQSKLSLLIDKCKCDVNYQSFDGSTPLILATGLEKELIFFELISRGADVNLTDAEGSTPLHIACALGRLDFVISLCEHGGNYWLKTKKGNFPLALAVNQEHSNVVKYLFDKMYN